VGFARPGVVFGMTLLLSALYPPGTALAETDAMAAFAALEARLLEAGSVDIEFDIRATGALEAALAGEAAVSRTGLTRVFADGSFAGAATDIDLVASEGRMAGGNGPKTFDVATPPSLSEGLLIGLTRMGLLHNLAVLSAGSPPDKTGGGVREWVTVEDLVLEDSAPIGGVETQAFGFTVVVGGQPSAVARLWIDARTGLPVRRTQVVSFPEGEMRVLEQYPSFRLSESR
jgi:hypothetical protein